MYSVYILFDKRTGWILYVGQTKSTIETRLRGHIRTALKKRKKMLLSLYIKEAGSENICIRCLRNCNSLTDALFYEKKYINILNTPFNVKR